MNCSYRQVWSAARGAYIIAPETARGNGKSGRAVRAVALAAVVLAANHALAQGTPATTVLPANTNTSAYVSANGVPVVNIANPNAAGLSHNQYNRYDVESKGLVLNNSSFKNAAVMSSQLAGQVVGNINLSSQAKVILNEVVATRRSTLAGFTEVLGGKADVIVANQYGITCDGCGFINSDRVTLTTGVPFLGADGKIGGFNVTGGDVLVGGAGLNASAQQILDIVTRTVRLDGQINLSAGGDLGIVTGPVQWSYGDHAITGSTQAGDAAPQFAIDSSTLGGMYAGRIRLIATEAGVGVRMLGDAAANAGDFKLDANGKVLMQGRVSASGDIAIAQAGTKGAGQLELSGANASLSAQKNVTLRTDGGLALNEGLIKAGASLAVTAHSLADTSTSNATRTAGDNVDLTLADAAAIGGASWGAGGHLAVTTGGNLAATGATLYSGSTAAQADRQLAIKAGGDATFVRTRLTGTDAGTLASAGKLGFDAGSEASAAAGLALHAATGFDNAGKLLAGADLALHGAAGMAAQNTGLLQAQARLLLGANGALALTNMAGGKLLGGTVAINATTFDNGGAVQGTDGVTVTASGALNNATDGLLLSTTAGKRVTINAASLTNAGRAQSAGALAVTTPGAVSNSGQLLTTAALEGGQDGALSVDALSLDNSGLLVSAGAARINTVGGMTNSRQIQGITLAVTAGKNIVNKGPDGVLFAQGDLTLQGAALDNGGAVQAGKNLSATLAGALANSGTLQTREAGGTLVLRGAALTNAAAGLVQAATVADLAATEGDLQNQGQIMAGDTLDMTAVLALDNDGVAMAVGKTTTRSASIANSGTLQGGALNASATGDVANTGAVLATAERGTLALQGADIVNSGTVQTAYYGQISSMSGSIDSSGKFLAGGTLDVVAAKELLTRQGSVTLAGGALNLGGFRITNSGMLQATTTLAADATDQFSNKGSVQSTGASSATTIHADAMYNSGQMQSAGAMALTARNGELRNDGGITAEGRVGMTVATTLSNTKSGVIASGAGFTASAADIDNKGAVQATRSLTAKAANVITNSGTLLVNAGNLALTGVAINNSDTLQANGHAALTATGAGITNSGKVVAGADMTIAVQTALRNSGSTAQLIATGDVTVSGAADFAFSNNGRVQAGGNLAIGAADAAPDSLQNTGTLFGTDVSLYGSSIVNQGRLQAMGNGKVVAGSLANLGSRAVMIFGIDHGDATVDVTGALRNEGALHSGGNVAIRAASIENTNTAGMSSLANATLTASSGGIVNAGALYAANTLTTSAADQTFTNTSSGTLDATDIVIGAATFNNYNTVIATNNTAITTTMGFNNLPTGIVPNILKRYTYARTTAPFDSGEHNCNIFGAACDREWVWSQDYTVTEYLDNAMPTQKGEIIAGNAITIRYGQSGLNQASLISAPKIDISGAGAFTNQDLHLEEISYNRRYRDAMTNSTFGDIEHVYAFPTTSAEYGCNNGTCYTGRAGSGGAAAANAFQLETDRVVIQKWRAGIYATDLTFNGGSLMNLGSPFREGTSATTATGTSAAPASQSSGVSVSPVFGAALQLVSGAKAAPAAPVRTVTVPAANGITFTGLNLTLPTNPNGYFVPVKNPTSAYLVETNPLFQVGSNSVGSSYLSKLLGIDPDKEQKRLGDANYEAKLVRDQLIAQTGNNIIKGMANEAAQMQALMDNAATQSSALGLVFGQPLTKDQASALTEDVVWMVEQVVNGQKVLAPVVYLAQSTRDAIEGGGPVMSATNATIKAGTLTNTGGTIAADTLAIETEGDVRNTGGKIKGGDVSVKSASGSIINETMAQTQGGKDFARTVIGATGSIESTGSLALDAAKDITIKGAAVKAGGDASLAAGGNVTLETIQDKRADSTYKASQGLWGISSSSESTHTATTTNIGSTLETGGNLKIKSGGDTTIAGSAVKVGGDLALDAGGNVNVVSVQDTVETSNSSSRTGLGVGGGVYGGTSTTTDTFKGRNVASGIEVGGNANVNTDGTLTLQGSKMKVDGDAAIAAGDVQILAGKDEDRTTTTTTTTSFLKLSGSGSTDSGAGAESHAGASSAASNKKGNAQAGAQAGAGASAGAHASASANAGLTLAETETTNTLDYKSRAVGSELEIGGALKVDSKKDIVLQGATVNTGGDTELNAARDVKILASQDIDISTSKTTTTSIGLFVDSENKASAGAEASAGAQANASSNRGGSDASASAQASARAGAEASSDTNIDLVRTTTTETNSLDIANNGTTLNTGGKLKIDAGNKLTVQGSDVSGEQGVALKARDMEFLAADDVSVTSTSTTKTSAGLYISGSASVEAGASAAASASASQNAGGTGGSANASAQAGASAEAKLGAGIQARHSTESSTEGATTARVSSIRSGSGDVERTATGSIRDVGTNIEAAGDFSQSATTITSMAAKDTTFSSSESQSDSVKIGVYAKAGAEAKAEASANADAGAGLLGPGMGSGTKSGAEAGANASVGVEAQYAHESASSSSSTSTAVVSTIKAGGKVTSKSSGKTTLEGTQVAAGGDIDVEAQSLEFKAARNTETSSESSLNVNAAANVGLNLGSDGAVDGGLSGGFDKGGASASSSTAVTGSLQSGGNLKIKTAGDARFEGTDIGAGGDAAIAAGGTLAFDAARNESSESSNNVNAEASLSVSKSKSASGGESSAGFEASAGYANDKASSSEAVTGKIASGGNLTLSSGKDMKFEGTSVQAGGDTGIEAGGNVDFAAARNTSSSESVSAAANVSLSGSSSSKASTGDSEKSRSGGFGIEGGYTREKSSEAVAGSLETGGNLKVKSGGNATFEGTGIAAGGAAAIDAKGDVNFKAAESTAESLGVSASLGGEASNTTKTGKAAGATTASTATEKERSASVGFELGTSSSSDKAAARLQAGSVAISAGRDASFEGTKVAADGDINVAAGRNVNVTTARSTSSDAGVSLSGEHSSTTNSAEPDARESSTRAAAGFEVGSSSTNDGASFASGGKTTIAAGGRATLVSTEVKAADGQQITAAGGVSRSTTVDTDSGIRMSAVGRADTKPAEAPAAAAAVPAAGAAAAGAAAPAPVTEVRTTPPAAVKVAAKPVLKQGDALGMKSASVPKS
jgi:filamentous hemagglutinin